MNPNQTTDDQEEPAKEQPPLLKAAEAAMVAQFEANAKVDSISQSDDPTENKGD